MTLPQNSTFVSAKHQISCDVAGEAVILDMQRGVYFGLNAVGASVWKQLREPKTLEELRSAIVAEYNVEVGRCERDIKDLLAQLLKHGLIEASPIP